MADNKKKSEMLRNTINGFTLYGKWSQMVGKSYSDENSYNNVLTSLRETMNLWANSLGNISEI